MNQQAQAARQLLEARFAELRPRVLAALNRQFRDLDRAEDAFSVACESALKAWPGSGVPDDPFAWLLVVARNRLRDEARSHNLRYTDAVDPHLLAEQLESNPAADPMAQEYDELRDDVLRLLFICCHPALSPQDQAAMALRVVVGMKVPDIAAAFLVRPRTMEQRLFRARQSIDQAQVPFETPSIRERWARLTAVSLMLYLMFSDSGCHCGGACTERQRSRY